MYQPETYGITLFLMIVSMLCWGSWANTLKLAPGWRFQLFYWDYVLGVLLTSVFFGLTLGNTANTPASFFNNIQQAGSEEIIYALLGGIVFNVANLLLVAAIEIAGLAVAFPIGIGLALVVGVLLNYILSPRGNPILLFAGVFLVVLAILFTAVAYRRKEKERPQTSTRGIVISLICGILMGLFYPFVTKAITGERALTPYTVAVVFAVGVLLCSVPVNYLFMRRPITAGNRLTVKDYLAGRPSWHLLGLLGGLIWCTGTVLNFVAAHAQLVGPAIAYAIGQGATMVSAIWGVFVWREFAQAPPAARRLLIWMFLCYVIGLSAVAMAPIVVF
jgi:glucose uptake protein